jgi:hypothetical protein
LGRKKRNAEGQDVECTAEDLACCEQMAEEEKTQLRRVNVHQEPQITSMERMMAQRQHSPKMIRHQEPMMMPRMSVMNHEPQMPVQQGPQAYPYWWGGADGHPGKRSPKFRAFNKLDEKKQPL